MRSALLVALTVLVLGAIGYSAAGAPGAVTTSGVCLLIVLVAARAALPKHPHHRRREPPTQAAQFRNYQHLSSLLEWSGSNQHYNQRIAQPYLHQLAAGVLMDRTNIDLDRQQRRARQLLGDQAWAAVRPHRDLEDLVSSEDIRALVARLESL